MNALQPKRNGAQLQRATLRTSRLLDFCSRKELIAQTGHQPEVWPLVVLKELVDNALDACEEAGVAPFIAVKVNKSGITVADNGPGIPSETIEGVLDFSVRVSSREAYVAPDRGAQGNALKTIVAMPFVLHGERGRVDISARGVRHRISFALDVIRQEPAIKYRRIERNRKKGTQIRVRWPKIAGSILLDAKSRFLQVAANYAWLNSHLTITVNWFGDRETIPATDPDWRKWKPSDPTSPHWYQSEHLERLVAAYLVHDQDHGRARTVREFISEFRGLSGTAKQKKVLETTGLGREPLSALLRDGALDDKAIVRLLDAMRDNSKPVKPQALGIIGKEHLQKRFEAAGCEMETFEYRKIMDTSGGVPWIIEAAFGWCPGTESGRLATGVNWSPAIINPFRDLGRQSLDTILSQARVYHDDEVILVLHMTCARVEFTDRGKSAVVVQEWPMCLAITDAVEAVTRKWTRQCKREEREASAAANRRTALIRTRTVSIKDAAYEVMAEAYTITSDNGSLPANARQVMYAARPRVLDLTGGRCWSKSSYFTQTLLPDYVTENPETTKDWDVVFDDRGHLIEPHTGKVVGLGTLSVRGYIGQWSSHVPNGATVFVSRPEMTAGPINRYRNVLFVEKEGFESLFQRADLRERYDIAIMSTKGMSVTAARHLVEELSASGVRIFVLHDFDKSGFSILETLRSDTRRYKFKTKPEVIDIGLRLEDIEAMSLQSELVHYSGRVDPRKNLRANGATEAECGFLVETSRAPWRGKRVEINAMTSRQVLDFVESKLAGHGVEKVVPGAAELARAFQGAVARARAQEIIDKMEKDAVEVPSGLEEKVRDQIGGTSRPWDRAIEHLAAEWLRSRGGAS